MAEEHAIKKKAEEEKLHTFKPNLSRKDRSRSRNRSEIEDISASKSPNDDSARRSISKNVKMQQNQKQRPTKIEDRLMKHGAEKKRKIQEKA